MAASIPWPTFSPEYAEATEKITQSTTPQKIDLNVSSGSLAAAGMRGWKDSPGFSGRYAFSGREVGSFSFINLKSPVGGDPWPGSKGILADANSDRSWIHFKPAVHHTLYQRPGVKSGGNGSIWWEAISSERQALARLYGLRLMAGDLVTADCLRSGTMAPAPGAA
jgi:hypothetical protein